MLSRKVLIIEDHPLVQQAVERLLICECTVVGTLNSVELATENIVALTPDVLILDASLPGCSGMRALPYLRQTFPELGIVLMTSHKQPAYRIEALRRGADAFVLKDDLCIRLATAVDLAAQRATNVRTAHQTISKCHDGGSVHFRLAGFYEEAQATSSAALQDSQHRRSK